MRVHHLALRVRDLDAASGFYRDVLGLAFEREQRDAAGRRRAVWFRLDDVVLMLELHLRGSATMQQGSGHVLALAIDDLEAWEARLARHGVPVDDRTPFTLFVSDPDGHRVGLTVHPPLTGAPAAGEAD